MSKIKLYEKFNTRNHGIVTVLDYIDCKNVLIKFENRGATKLVRADHLRDGNIKDQTQPTVYGIGVIGNNFDKGESHTLTYNTWNSMLQRCYDLKLKERHKSYEQCSVDANFLSYEYFKDWCSKQIGFGNEGWQLDKDILVKGNKVYSEDTCCFVPKEINSMISGFTSKGGNTVGVYENKAGNFYIRNLSEGSKKCSKTFSNQEEAERAYVAEKNRKILTVMEKWDAQLDSKVKLALSLWLED